MEILLSWQMASKKLSKESKIVNDVLSIKKSCKIESFANDKSQKNRFLKKYKLNLEISQKSKL
jgi:hypothetical protein